MLDIMLDLETMGRRADSAIVAIGAVEFDLSAGVIGDTFYCTVDLSDAIKHGCSVDGDTVAWWLVQSEEARQAIVANPLMLSPALLAFSGFVDRCGPRSEVRIWGNGPSFDNAILSHAYEACQLLRPWEFWNERCVRTIRALAPDIQPDAFVGVKHHALDDAMAQAKHLIKIRHGVRGAA